MRSRELVALIRQRREGIPRLREKTRRPLATLMIASRRLMSKLAQMFVLQGDFAAAAEWFGASLQISALRHQLPAQSGHEQVDLFSDTGNILSGETGRAYCCMLMHGGRLNELERAQHYIDANVKKAEANTRHYERVDWLVLRASLERLKGDRDAAVNTLKIAQKLRAETGVNISFGSSVIMATEEERLRVRGTARRQVSRKLESMYRIAEGSAHQLLACDAALMIAETISVPAVRAEWTTKARRIVANGYGFRRLDLERIEHGGPFDDLL